MDYRVKKVGDDWYFLPEEERLRKLKYERLYNKIKSRERRIVKTEETLKEIKKELRVWNKERTKEYNLLVKYHKEFIPGLSVSLSKNPKRKDPSKRDSTFNTGGNRSWTIYITVQGERKPMYLGTVKDVNNKLDLIEGKLEYFELKPDKNIRNHDRIKNKIEKLVFPLIKQEMLKILTEEGSLDSFLNVKQNGMKHLDELYKNSIYYEEPKPKKPKPKGERMVVFRPPPSYWKNKKKK